MTKKPELLVRWLDLKKHTEHLTDEEMGRYMRRVVKEYKFGLISPLDPRKSDPLPEVQP